MSYHSSKLLVIVGPTSSGKSELAVKIAKKINGEIISADSRQIYRGMDLGTGKVPGKWVVDNTRTCEHYQHFIYKNVIHHCIDFVNPKRQYSVALYQRDAKKVIADVLRRGKLPVLSGGTAHWIDAVVYNQMLPSVKPDLKLRRKLGKKSADDLYRKLKKLDPHRAANIDRHNKRRLIRALEIVTATGKPIPPLSVIPEFAEGKYPESYKKIPAFAGMTTYTTLWLGLNPGQRVLDKKIKTRLKQRLKAGMAKEVIGLHQQGLSWKKLESFGLEYKFVSLYLQKKLSYDEMFAQLFIAIKQYSRRQMTWWKRNKNIQWLERLGKSNQLVEKFLK